MDTIIIVLLAGLLIAAVVLAVILLGQKAQLSRSISPALEEKHRALIRDLNDGLNKLGDRLGISQTDASDRLRASVAQELQATRDNLNALQVSQTESLAATRLQVLEKIHTTLAEQGKAEQELIQGTMRNATLQLTTNIEALTKTVDGRLEQIGGKVGERLDEGFAKTNEVFLDVIRRLTIIDQAQEKLEGLSKNLVSVQDLLGDKSSRGAFGEVQLAALVGNILPPTAYELQHTLTNGARADCVLFLPEPTGTLVVDSKFPLENYKRMYEPGISEAERLAAQRLFKANVRKHIDDIADKYIIPGHTSDGAVMFLPAEAVFAEIHAYNPELVEYAQRKHVWCVSPTTLMAVLNTARAVLKDVETRQQVHIIKDELGKLGKEFERFDKRMQNLATHIRQAHDDVQDVHTTSQKISNRFTRIEKVELEGAPLALPNADDDDDPTAAVVIDQ